MSRRAGFFPTRTAMNPDSQSSPPPAVPDPAPGTTARPSSSGNRPLLIGCAAVVMLVLVALVATGITYWWMQRPIKPVTLNEPEWRQLEEKLPAARPDNTYEPGERSISLSEREVNALLERNTGLGNRLQLSFDRGAVNARFAIPVPDDVPILGGITIRGRGRMLAGTESDGTPRLMLQDVTVFGISLPNAWLGGLKNRDLLVESLAGGERPLPGIREIRLEPGTLHLELEE